MTDALRLHTATQAGELLGLHAKTVYRLIRSGQLCPITLPGGQMRLTGVELERYVRETQQRAWDSQTQNIRWLRDHSSPVGGRAGSASRNRKARV